MENAKIDDTIFTTLVLVAPTMSEDHSRSNTLFVGDLPPDIHESDFVAAFKPFRGFTTARLRQDKNDRYVPSTRGI
jgi:hypothetical protein